jgi:ACT domain-containing protein
MTTTSFSCLTPSSESAQAFLKHIESIPADERYYQIFIHLEANTNALSRAVQVIEQSGADLLSISILSSPVQHKRIVVLRFADRDLKNVLIDLIQSGYLEVKGCGPRFIPGQM